MKYVLQWTVREGGSAQQNMEAMKRSLEVLSKWTPSTTVHQFVTRVDAEGGFAVGETEDLAALAKDCAIFTPYVAVTMYPVLDIEQGVAILQAGIDFNESR